MAKFIPSNIKKRFGIVIFDIPRSMYPSGVAGPYVGRGDGEHCSSGIAADEAPLCCQCATLGGGAL